MKELMKHVWGLRPILDRENKFIFTVNHKVGTISVTRGALPDRFLSGKYQKTLYPQTFHSYTEVDFYRMFKFTIIRNPYDRMVSTVLYLQKTGRISPEIPFGEFVKKVFVKEGPAINPHFHPQYPSVFFNSRRFVNFIANLENIQEDWFYIAKKIGCTEKLPRINKTPHRHYSTYYDDEIKQIVDRFYPEDVKYLGYDFENGLISRL